MAFSQTLNSGHDDSDIVEPLSTPPDFAPEIQPPLKTPRTTVSPLEPQEIVNDKGQMRQAGADNQTVKFLASYKKQCERSLYLFGYSILGLDLLTMDLHKPVCDWLTQFPYTKEGTKYRKGLLLPRDHLKTSIMSRSLPIHIIVQPQEHNIYFLGCQSKPCQRKRAGTGERCLRKNHRIPGSLTRILLSSETIDLAGLQMSWCATHLHLNERLRGFWPEVCWTNPRMESQSWNKQEITVRRPKAYPEPTIDTVGVGGAIAGRHYDVIIKDDLVTLNAANSSTIMERAREWHKAARALFHDQEMGLEFVAGTRWAPGDIYDDMLADDTMEFMVRSIVEDGEPIFPMLFPLRVIPQMKKEYGSLFPLIYMNDPKSPELTDFDTDLLRSFSMKDGKITFEEDWRDDWLRNQEEERLDGANLSGLLSGDMKLLDNLIASQGNLRLRVNR